MAARAAGYLRSMPGPRPLRVGYHASHEQFAPSSLIRWVRLAEEAGFDAAMCSDHFHPWSEVQGQSGFAWSWLGSALEATSLPMGTVCAPGQRYHPAVVAQAAATLGEMYPGRFWLALGSGQNLNEHITGDRWPTKAERNERLAESVQVIRSLWRGEAVTHRGHVVVEEATLHTRPPTPPLLVGAAITPATAAWVAGWADGLITVAQPVDRLRQVVDAFRDAGGSGKPVRLQVQLSYAPTRDEALHAAYQQWRTNVFASAVLSDLRTPGDFEAAAEVLSPDDVDGPVVVSADPGEHADRLAELIDVGIDEVLLHDVHPDQERFVRDFGEAVIPRLVAA